MFSFSLIQPQDFTKLSKIFLNMFKYLMGPINCLFLETDPLDILDLLSTSESQLLPWYLSIILGQASLVAQLVKNLLAVWETWVWSLGGEDSLEKGKATHPSILAWRIPWIV